MSDDSDDSVSLGGSGSSNEGSVMSEASSSPKAKKPKTTKDSPAPKAPTKKGTSAPRASSATVKAKPAKSDMKAVAQSTKAMPVPVAEPAGSSADNNLSGDITRGPPVTTDIAAKKLIGQYLRQQNRPYSAIQIHDNLHKRIQKGTIERVLTSMCLPGAGFICKEYGKAKIYFIDQGTLPADFSADQLEELQAHNEELKKQVELSSAEDRRVREELQQLQAEPTDADLDGLLQEARARVAEKRERVARLGSRTGGTGGVGNGNSSNAGKAGGGELRYKTLAATVQAHNFFRKAWAARRLQCMEAVDLLCEGLGKKAKDVTVSDVISLTGVTTAPVQVVAFSSAGVRCVGLHVPLQQV
jgi:hypothetical protein